MTSQLSGGFAASGQWFVVSGQEEHNHELKDRRAPFAHSPD
jgi:hypothetical protein